MVCAVVLESVFIAMLLSMFLWKLKKKNNCILSKDSAIESLRVVNHDYKNKMHVLMGYIETDRFDDAKIFINNVRSVPTEELLKITGIIKNPSVAALIIGKLIEAREFGIALNVMPDSVCEVLTDNIPINEYITVIGNILQNAIDELEACDSDNKNIDLFINIGRKWSLVSVMDNGRGIPEDKIEEIFKMGYTTKNGKNRGFGLYMVKKVVNKHNGSVEIESEEGEGTEVTVSMRG